MIYNLCCYFAAQHCRWGTPVCSPPPPPSQKLFRKHSLSADRKVTIMCSSLCTLSESLWECLQMLRDLACSPYTLLYIIIINNNNNNLFFPMARQPLVDQSLLIIEALRSHSDTAHSVGLLWTSDQPDAKTCTWQPTTPTMLPRPLRDTNP
jgi:hypothetical protein